MQASLASPLERFILTLRFRWVGLAVVILALAVLQRFLVFDWVQTGVIVLLAVVELSIVTLWMRHAARDAVWRSGSRDRLVSIISQVQVIAELFLLTLGVHLTGGVVSPLLPGYLLYLFVSGLRTSVPALIFNTIWVGVLVTGLFFAEYQGMVSRASLGLFQDSGLERNPFFVLTVLVGLLSFLGLSAVVATWISHTTGKRELALAQSAEALARRVDEVNALREMSERLAASLDLREVLDATGESALRLVHATDAHLFVYDEETGQFSDGVGVWADGHRGLAVAKPRAGNGLSAAVVSGRQAVIINDAANHPFYASLQARSWGVQAIAGFPLKKAERLLGVMNVAFLEPHSFTDDEVHALAALADQAAIAVDNARLYAQVQRKIQELSSLYAVASAASQFGDLQALASDALGAALETLHAGAALLFQVDERHVQFQLMAHRGLSAIAVNELKSQALSLREGFAGEAVETGRAVTSADLPIDPRYQWHFEGAEQWQAVYALPLSAREQCIAVLVLLWPDKHEVLPAEANFIAAIGQQLTAGLSNLALYDEIKRRADELTSLRTIGLATTSTLNLREQLRLLYDKVNQLLSPDIFIVGLFDEAHHELKIEYLVEDGWFVRRPSMALESDSLGAWVIQNQKAMLVQDVAASQDLPARPPQLGRPARSWLGVPLVLKDNTVGLMAVSSYKPNAFLPEDERFLVAVAQHLALAVDNARLFAEAERRARELMLINEISRAVSASLELEVVLDRAARALGDLLGYRYVSIFLIQEDELRLQAKLGHHLEFSPARVSTSAIGRVARTGHAAFIPDVSADPDYVALIPEVVAQLAVPIQRETRILGVIDVEEVRAGTLKAGDLVLLSALADQLGIAAANAEVYHEALAREEFANALGRVGLTLASTLDVTQLIELVCRESLGVFAVDGAALFLREVVIGGEFIKPGNNLVCRAAAGSASTALNALKVEGADLTNFVARTSRLARGIVIHLALESPQLSSEWCASLGAQSVLSVPLLKEREVVGVLVLVDSHNPARFDESDLSRAAVYATQAALAFSNARLYDETQHRAAEVTSLYEIGLTVSSTLDLGEQLRIVNDQITRYFHPQAFYIALLDEAAGRLNFPIFSDHGVLLEPFSRQLEEPGFASWVVQSRRPLVVDDVKREWERLPVKPIEVGTPLETASFFSAPLLNRGRVIGCLALQRAPIEPFTPDEQRFLLSLAQQVAVAADSARLHEQERRTAAQQTLLYETSRKIAGAPNIDILLQTVVDSFHADFGYENAAVMLVDPEKGELVPAAASQDLAPAISEEHRQKIGVGLIGQAAQTGLTQLANAAQADSLFIYPEDRETGAALAVPVRMGEKVIGVVNVERAQVNSITSENVRMIEGIADQLAIAIENARLYQQTRDQLERLKEAQERLVESERRAAVGELASGLAHEINNPLTAIIGHTQLMLQAKPSSPQALDTALTTISLASQRIARIMQEFVRLTSIESMRRQVLDLRDITRDATAAFEEREGTRNIGINLKLPTGAQWVNGNRNLLNQVLTNILVNSGEAMPHGGKVSVEVHADGGESIMCSVHDTGVGIPESDLKRVFEPGYTTKIEGGTVRGIGLGLYTAELIIRNHNGKIWLQSAVGQGTTVSFTLPHVQGFDGHGE